MLTIEGESSVDILKVLFKRLPDIHVRVDTLEKLITEDSLKQLSISEQVSYHEYLTSLLVYINQYALDYMKSTEVVLTSQEIDLVNSYRLMSEDTKEMVLKRFKDYVK